MPWLSEAEKGDLQRVDRSIDIDADIEQVFENWTQYEELPHRTESVYHARCIDPNRVLFDVDVAGRQFVWEAHIVESVPTQRIRWVSRWGVPNAGEVRFEKLPHDRTRLHIAIEFRPRGVLERLGARLGVLDRQLARDLARFRDFVHRAPHRAAPAPRRFEARAGELRGQVGRG